MRNAAPRPLVTRMLAQSAYEALRTLIVTGEIDPGARIRVDELATRWEISRTPVREAISRLALVDLVTVARNSRTEVAQWSPRDMLERVEIIASLASAASSRLSGGAVPAGPHATTEHATDVHEFLAQCQTILDRSGNRVSRSAVAKHFSPIAEEFYSEHVALRFGVDLEPDADERRRLVATLHDAVAEGAGARIRAAIASYLQVLARSH